MLTNFSGDCGRQGIKGTDEVSCGEGVIFVTVFNSKWQHLVHSKVVFSVTGCIKSVANILLSVDIPVLPYYRLL